MNRSFRGAIFRRGYSSLFPGVHRPVSSVVCITSSRSHRRSYHVQSGVYGYVPAKPREFTLSDDVIQSRAKNSTVLRFIDAYRDHGHLKAEINPLRPNTRIVPELDPKLYGLSGSDKYDLEGLVTGSPSSASLEELEQILQEKYCGHLGVEFTHLLTLEEREWFANAVEELSDFVLPVEKRVRIAKVMLQSQAWDKFLTNKFQSVKRYGGEGAESLMAFITDMFEHLSSDNVEEVLIGMAHRGRLNLLYGPLKLPASIMFAKMKGLPEFPTEVKNSGDVLSHLTSSVDLDVNGKKLHVSMMPNPSHLEAINPVVCGKTRGRQCTLGEDYYSGESGAQPGDKVVNLQVHGDAAIGGQGVIQETLALYNVPHFQIGGSIHLVINNQVGYTAPSENTRSSLYCTDIAKMCSFPIIHVNGDQPEAVMKATKLAVDYQRKFRRDVFVDLLCWRRWGHNELDEPRFTNPLMYKNIEAKKSVPDSYADKLVEEGVMSQDDVRNENAGYMKELNEQFSLLDSYTPKASHLKGSWAGLVDSPSSIEVWDTGVDIETMKYIGAKSVEFPEDFKIHPTLKRSHVEARIKKLSEGTKLDWATAEAVAMGSLLHEGYNVRISGQDVGRGTFSQRHCMLVNQETDDVIIPLNDMVPDQKTHLEVVNSILSEEAVLGFEYGMSVEHPQRLCIWEAQFGDFFNGAQIMIDTFVSSGETKWLMQSGLVMILPHGYDGAGPEHSSSHIERFLQNCDSKEDRPDGEDINWSIAFPTTPAQYFHLLRRQMIRNYRKPLIMAGPKGLLRLPAAVSPLSDMAPGTHFKPVLGDQEVPPENVKKVVFTSGKHYYTLAAEREKRGLKDVALVRVEGLCPFPVHDINQELAKYKNAKTFVWSQEEHRNMGSWFFVRPRFENLCSTKLKYVGRDSLGTPAVGIGQVHTQEARELLEKTFSI
ncbi:2-oxoadipate dehydrogenase complex component E1 [Oratosquilla oratoria]|uniref:2-oxoadipate dehydrogenase complex component E1 n=1 Tax=Oratosquilla oratoria TaxID=337810 RepID=UPI003F759A08